MRFRFPWSDRKLRRVARTLYAAIVQQARCPAFYGPCGVPDTLDGRFELVTLHGYLLLRRLQDGRLQDGAAGRLPQHLFDTMFIDMSFCLREIGVGDLRVGKRVKHMVASYYGRVAAYDAGLASGDLEPALARNLFGTVAAIEDQTLENTRDYVIAAATDLAAQPMDQLCAGLVSFPDPAAFYADRHGPPGPGLQQSGSVS